MNATQDSARVAELLRALHETLQAERAALIDNDAERIYACSEDKTKHLRRLGELPRQPADALAGFTPDLRALAELNIANGALIARRRQDTVWTLRQLGLYEGGGGYDSRGDIGSTVKTRHRTIA